VPNGSVVPGPQNPAQADPEASSVYAVWAKQNVGDIKAVITNMRMNLEANGLVNPGALNGFGSLHVIPHTFIFERNNAQCALEITNVWVEITARANRGVNCPSEQVFEVDHHGV
jgi:hypothetical protein